MGVFALLATSALPFGVERALPGFVEPRSGGQVVEPLRAVSNDLPSDCCSYLARSLLLFAASDETSDPLSLVGFQTKHGNKI